jgi:acyl-CoA thioester hydrolase
VSTPLRIEPRWTDLDPAGHVTNSVFLVYAEEARDRFLKEAVPDAWRLVVVVHNAIDYHSPVLAREAVDVTSFVESLGTTSFTSIAVITTVDGRKCATVRTVQVVLHPHRRSSRPWTDAERAAITRLVPDTPR